MESKIYVVYDTAMKLEGKRLILFYMPEVIALVLTGYWEFDCENDAGEKFMQWSGHCVAPHLTHWLQISLAKIETGS